MPNLQHSDYLFGKVRHTNLINYFGGTNLVIVFLIQGTAFDIKSRDESKYLKENINDIERK